MSARVTHWVKLSAEHLVLNYGNDFDHYYVFYKDRKVKRIVGIGLHASLYRVYYNSIHSVVVEHTTLLTVGV